MYLLFCEVFYGRGNIVNENIPTLKYGHMFLTWMFILIVAIIVLKLLLHIHLRNYLFQLLLRVGVFLVNSREKTI